MVVHETVSVGSWVEVQDGPLRESWRIMPTEEADAMRRWISVATPLGRALLGHKAGEQVRVDGPEGRRLVSILSVA